MRWHALNVRRVFDRLAQPLNVVVEPPARNSSLCDRSIGSVRLLKLVKPRRGVGCDQLLLQPRCATTARFSRCGVSAFRTSVDLFAELTQRPDLSAVVAQLTHGVVEFDPLHSNVDRVSGKLE